MQKDFTALFTVIGMTAIIAMFTNIVSYVDCQSPTTPQSTHIISAFNG